MNDGFRIQEGEREVCHSSMIFFSFLFLINTIHTIAGLIDNHIEHPIGLGAARGFAPSAFPVRPRIFKKSCGFTYIVTG